MSLLYSITQHHRLIFDKCCNQTWHRPAYLLIAPFPSAITDTLFDLCFKLKLNFHHHQEQMRDFKKIKHQMLFTIQIKVNHISRYCWLWLSAQIICHGFLLSGWSRICLTFWSVWGAFISYMLNRYSGYIHEVRRKVAVSPCLQPDFSITYSLKMSLLTSCGSLLSGCWSPTLFVWALSMVYIFNHTQ